ncbi:hypothetical protein H5410_025520 [Solanum commersonii]|uniref:NADP-dependent oxidoreductase domain-containing protein n=1 Tax=Solanum commersonii TaxID=4109 RepID=A0A9J5YY65_SOLCO|nr:hypothetical protein H5410_025520 [Solanum commersonii]
MDYLDLYHIHWPVRMKNGSDQSVKLVNEDVIPFDIRGTWEAMEECYKLGLAKSIGVCNFSCTKLSQLLSHATIPPAVNQVEMHVAWRQEKMLAFCKEKGIHVSAWSPLGANGIPFWGNHAVMQNSVLKDIAFHRQKSIPQVALRWVYEQGVSVLVKSFNKDRMRENLQILDWELNNEENAKIQEIPQCRGFKGDLFVHPDGPYKSPDEFWDGMGTAPTAPTLPPIDQLVSIFIDAIEAGYRHFDTAAAYGSEEALGRAVAEAIQRRLIESREDVFITSKLWCTETHHGLVLPALKRSLARLGMDYLDLYHIHWPVRMKNGSDQGVKFVNEDVIPFDMKGTWEAIEECHKLGLAKSIGVCNFSCTKLSQLLSHATIPPAVNQVEMHVAWRQEKMLAFCKEKGIHVSAWSPLGANGIPFWGNHAVMQNSVLKDIAFHRQKSIPQVALRWVYEQGVSVLVKSFNKDRMRENLQILDWELSNEENAKIQEIPQCRGFKGELLVHPDGPYKSPDEFWDGEL